MGNLGSHVDGELALSDHVQVLAEGFPAPGDALGQGRAGDVLDALHQGDQPLLLAGPHRCESDATVARHHGRDAVIAGRFEHGVPAHLSVVVGMDVDESGGHDSAGGIDGFGRVTGQCGVVRTAPMYLDDLAVLDRDVGGEPVRTGAVDDSAAGDFQIEHVLLP